MSNTTYEIKELELTDKPDEFLQKVCDFWDIQFRWYEKDDPLPDREQRIYNIRNPRPSYTSFEWFVFDNDKIIADAFLGFENEKSPSYEENKHIFGGNIAVLPEYRRQGIAKRLVKIILKRAREQGKTILQTGASLPIGFTFIEDYLGGKVGQSGAENRLKTMDIDWKMVDHWIEDGETRNKETELVFFERCPDDIIEEYMEMYSKVMNQMPKGDMEWVYKTTPEKRREDEKRMAERGINWYTYISVEQDGEISGMTEMIYNTKRPFRLNQELTGVKEAHRGRGLGKWLKAKMLRKMHDMYPNVVYIATGNASDNKPMLAINDRLGFKQNRVWQGYKIKIEDLEL